MKTKEEIFNRVMDGHAVSMLSVSDVFKMMDEYAKQQSIAFLKWYNLKIVGFIEYLTKVKPIVKSEEIEERLLEFEGQTFDNLYAQFAEHQSLNK